MPDVNYLAVLVAGVLAMVIGGLWYSPMLFGNLWMKLAKVKMPSKEQMQKDMPKHYLGGLVLALVSAWVLAHFLGLLEASTPAEAAQVAFWAWLGFVGAKYAGRIIWEGSPPKLFVINAGYELVTMLVMALVIQAWV